METLSYKQCRDLWCDLVEKDVDTVNTAELAKFERAFNRALRRGWEWWWWPELMLSETRYFRAEWSATSYAAGAEVYHASTDKYWCALTSCAAGDVPGADATKWAEITDLDAYVAYEQSGQTELGTVREIWTGNPRTDRTARPLQWEYDERGVTITSSTVPTSVWLNFRKRCPQWRGATYDAASGVAEGLTRYYASTSEGFDGDFWTTVATAIAGESPESTPAKWAKVAIPTFLADFGIHGAKIAQLEGDGQLEKALANTQSELWGWLYDEQDKFSAQSTPRRVRFANL